MVKNLDRAGSIPYHGCMLRPTPTPGLFRPLSRLILEVVPRDPPVFSLRRQGQNDLVCRLPLQDVI